MKNLFLTMTILGTIFFTSCKNTDKSGIVDSEKQLVIDSMKAVAEKQRIIDSMKIEAAKTEKEKEVIVVNNAASPSSTTTKKKGWSGAAKGAVIGAGVGAATGAIVSKKKGEGAVIGAGSFVNKDCEPWGIYVGSPARKIGERPRLR